MQKGSKVKFTGKEDDAKKLCIDLVRFQGELTIDSEYANGVEGYYVKNEKGGIAGIPARLLTEA